MALVNNWDLKDVNNRVSDTSAGGAALRASPIWAPPSGAPATSSRRSKGVSKDYAETTFIDEVTPTHVDFVMQSRPFFPFVVHLPNYRFRTRMESIVKRIPHRRRPLDWRPPRPVVGEQISDCFRASGFARIRADRFARRCTHRRVSDLQAADRRRRCRVA